MRAGERRTFAVIAITAVMMVVEIAAGLAYGSMALLADGLHMASHTAAIGIAAFAYVYARRHAFDPRFSFGTGKVNALGGFGGAVLLVVFAVFMAWESTLRFLNPVEIAFNQAIVVAVVGLVVNAVSALILGHSGGDEHGHDHGHSRGHAQEDAHDHNHHDHNLRAAYLHVVADAMTSVLAIIALLAGKYFGQTWLDPLMGILGAILVAKWSMGLLKTTAQVLLDHQESKGVRHRITTAIEEGEPASVTDLHVWSIGPNLRAAAIVVVTDTPREPDDYRRLLPTELGLSHVTIEVHQCPEAPELEQVSDDD